MKIAMNRDLKKDKEVLLYILGFTVLIIIFGAILLGGGSSDITPNISYEEQNRQIIEQSLIKETSNGREGVCELYDIYSNIITLWCTGELLEGAESIILGRIKSGTEGKLRGHVEYTVKIIDWDTDDTIVRLEGVVFQK